MPQKFAPGDIFGIPLPDGSMAVGQVLSVEPEALNAVGCLFTAGVVANGKVVSPPEPVAALLVTPDLLKNGSWPVKSSGPVSLEPDERPYERYRAAGWVGAKVVGSANAQALVSAYHGHTPWDEWHDPNYLDSLLLPGVVRPKAAVLRSGGS